MRCMFVKGQGGMLIPCDPNAEKLVASVKLGGGVSMESKKARNIAFHRKFFTLLQLAFDIWEPESKEYKGEVVSKNFERFREDILILAGMYDATYNIRGDVRLKAKSISFANMDDHEFEEVYRSVLDVVWEKVLRGANFKSQAEVESVVAQLMAYGS